MGVASFGDGLIGVFASDALLLSFFKAERSPKSSLMGCATEAYLTLRGSGLDALRAIAGVPSSDCSPIAGSCLVDSRFGINYFVVSALRAIFLADSSISLRRSHVS